MRLRQRIVLALLAITVILVAPATYGIAALRELQQIATRLRTRDALGALALGRIQAGLGEAEYQQRVYVALASDPLQDREAARQKIGAAIAEVDSGVARLAPSGYADATAALRREWGPLRAALRQQEALIESGQIARADLYQEATITPAFASIDGTLEPVGAALNQGGREQVDRARGVASRAATTTLLAIALALLLALLIAGWLTRTLLGPIGELRRGMGRVSEGNLDPHVRISPARRDELGDLARSFRSMTEQLAELDRLKAEFVSIASHELKTPLSVIRGYVSLLRDGIYGPVSETQEKTLTAVGEQTDRLTRLVGRLLDVSRFEAGSGRLETRAVPLQPFLAELHDDFEVLAQQNRIDFALETDPSLPDAVEADADRLNEVLGNLLSNAFKFTEPEGSIRLRAARDADRLRIEVEDSGVGIPADQLPRIFEKFYQVENVAQPRSAGSGLGLAIAKEIVEAHGGTIAAESRVEQGTRFSVLLPLTPPAPAPAGRSRER